MASASFRESMNSLGWSRREPDAPVNTAPPSVMDRLSSLNPFGAGGYVRLPISETNPGAPLPAPTRREEEEGWFACKYTRFDFVAMHWRPLLTRSITSPSIFETCHSLVHLVLVKHSHSGLPLFCERHNESWGRSPCDGLSRLVGETGVRYARLRLDLVHPNPSIWQCAKQHVALGKALYS